MKNKFEYNKELLYRYRDYILNLPKLDFKSAKDLYNQIQQEENLEIRKRKMQNLINGTLYVVYNFIDRNNLISLISSDYDIDDIISICNEIWIEKIKNGIFNKVSNYGMILNGSFIAELSFKVCEFNIETRNLTILNSNNFSKVFNECFDLYKKGLFNYESFKLIVENNISDKRVLMEEIAYIKFTYDLILSIFETSEDFYIPKSKVEHLRNVLTNVGIKSIQTDVEELDIEDESFNLDKIIDKTDLISKINYALNFTGFTEREIKIIKLRFGLEDGKYKTLEEVGKIIGVSRGRINQIETKILRKLRYPKRSDLLKDFVGGE